MTPVDLAHTTAGHHAEDVDGGAGGEGGGPGYGCGASRCSLIVRGDCAAGVSDPLLLYADGAVSSIMGTR